MISLAGILVDIDAVAADHPALEQAIGLATRCGARVKIVDVLPRVPAGVRHFVTPDLEKELVDHRRERLKAIADGVQAAPAVPVPSLVDWPAWLAARSLACPCGGSRPSQRPG